ncbi:MAG: TonB-dependent receptor plug domain-containing protein, partial [Prevotella sp.]|nr:TonB-dependent receptor plug domain-containing protein [Prevotella sp.]
MKLRNVIIIAASGLALYSQAQEAIELPSQSGGTGGGADTVQVAFRTMDSRDLMGAVSMVDMNEMNAKNYTTYSLDNMQSLVGGFNGSLWNQGGALILVDGVPREATNVHPEEIEQITFLKSAQAVVLYGSRGAKGVIMITTKRGREDGLRVEAGGNITTFVPKRYPNYLGSAQYMTLYNEALRNDGLSPVYSEEDIWHYANHDNPYRYPEINFFSDDYVRKSYQRYDGHATFQGGGKFAHFYTFIGLSHANDLLDFGEGENNYTNSLSVRGNIDLRLNDWVTGWIDADATFYDARGDLANYWGASATLRPTSQYPLSPFIPVNSIDPNDETSRILAANSNHLIDGQYLLGGTQNQQTNPFAAMYAAGYNKYTSRQMQFDAGVKLDLRRVLKGLSFKTHFAVDYATSYNTSINNEYSTYEATWNNANGKDQITSLTKYGTDKSTGTQNISGSYDRQTMLFNAEFDYNRSFDDHNVAATLLANGYQQTVSGEYHRTSNANLGLQLNWNLRHTYYADLSMAV